jgi:pSer/pThr/pTyr-binding forkhead associated (FHA) protein
VISPIARRVASRILQAAYLNIGDVILFGKYKNKHGKIVSFGEDQWGNPTIDVEPIPKGRKKNKTIGLYRVWRADVKEKELAKRGLT